MDDKSRWFQELVSGQQQGIGAAVLRSVLNLLELPYSSVTAIRNFLYDSAILPVYRLPIPVISVGNLTLGGTGKSPMVAWLGQYFLDQGIQPGIISRGYGKSADGTNDEFLELAFRLPSVRHLQNRNRVAAAQDFLVSNTADVLILDDAFQHRRIRRNLDIVLLDASVPFGYEHVFPRGTLRESTAALRRADIVFLSRADLIDEDKRTEIRNKVLAVAPNIFWGEVVHEPQSLISVSKKQADLSSLFREYDKYSKRVLAFCGIGNPNAFRQTLDRCGVQVIDLIPYPDHHQFTPEDLDKLEEIVRQTKADSVLCTMKDIVKIKRSHLNGVPIQAVSIKIRFLTGEEEFRERLKKVISNSYKR